MLITDSAMSYVLADVIFVPYGEGGRIVMPVGSGYAPYLRSQFMSEDLAVRINNIPAGAQFGQVIRVAIELTYYPAIDYGPLAEGVTIYLIEGPKVVARGNCRSSIIAGLKSGPQEDRKG